MTNLKDIFRRIFAQDPTRDPAEIAEEAGREFALQTLGEGDPLPLVNAPHSPAAAHDVMNLATPEVAAEFTPEQLAQAHASTLFQNGMTQEQADEAVLKRARAMYPKFDK